MSKAIVCIGSNFGNRKDMLKQALERLSFSSQIESISEVYETFPKTVNGQPPYLNCCVLIQTDMTSNQLIQFLIESERQLNSSEIDIKFHHSTIDFDLVSFDDEIIRTPVLTLPHPDAHRRAFVMIPLAEICPDWVHPVLKKRADILAQEAFWPGWGNFYAHGKSLLDF